MVEFVLVSMITGFGPTAGEALSGVLAYRAVNFWLPIPFGGLAYASLEFERRPTYRKLQDYLRRRFELPAGARPLPGHGPTATAADRGHGAATAGAVSDRRRRPAATSSRPPAWPPPAPASAAAAGDAVGAEGAARGHVPRRARRDSRACVWQ